MRGRHRSFAGAACGASLLVLLAAASCASQSYDTGSSGAGGDRGQPGSSSVGTGPSEIQTQQCKTCSRPDCGCPDASGLTGAGIKTPIPNCPASDVLPFSVALTSATSKSIDSAVYARAVLSDGHAPVPGVLRLSDFLNFYAPADAQGDAVGVAYDGASAPYAGVVELRTTTPPAAQRSSVGLTIVVDASQSLSSALPAVRQILGALAAPLSSAQGDEVSVFAWSPTLDKLYAGPPEPLVGAPPSIPIGKGGGDLADMIANATTVAAQQAASDRHIVFVSDGGVAPPVGIETRLSAALDVGVSVDAIVVAPRLGLEAAGDRPYNQALLTSLTPFGGGRILAVTDGGVLSSDSESLLRDRFFELFANAAVKARANAELPSQLFTPLSIVPQDFAGSDLLSASAQDELGGLPVGYGRTISFRLPVAIGVDPTTLFQPCGAYSVTASLAVGDASPSTLGPVPLSDLSTPSATLLTHQAIEAFVNALRVPPSDYAVVNQRLVAASAAAKCPVGDPATPGLCAAIAEMAMLLHKHPSYH